jgi:xylulose-5-phosphate/fructose-6-phosphate phosphoketolase
VNVIVADKAPHLQYLTMEEAVEHFTQRIGIWDWASSDEIRGRAGRQPASLR